MSSNKPLHVTLDEEHIKMESNGPFEEQLIDFSILLTMHFHLSYLFIACTVAVEALAIAQLLEARTSPEGAGASSAFAQRTYFYAGGNYVNATQKPLVNESAVYMVGQIYVEKLVPHNITQKTPLVFISGDGQTLTVRLRASTLDVLSMY